MLIATIWFALCAIFFIVILSIPKLDLFKVEIIMAVILALICIWVTISCYNEFKHQMYTKAIESYIEGNYDIVTDGNSYYYEIYPVDND